MLERSVAALEEISVEAETCAVCLETIHRGPSAQLQDALLDLIVVGPIRPHKNGPYQRP